MNAKVYAAVVAGAMFFLISSPYFYRLVDSLIGDRLGRIASASGCPTTWGLVVHSIVFGLATYYGLGV